MSNDTNLLHYLQMMSLVTKEVLYCLCMFYYHHHDGPCNVCSMNAMLVFHIYKIVEKRERRSAIFMLLALL